MAFPQKAVLLEPVLLEPVLLQAVVSVASEPPLPNPALAPTEAPAQEQSQVRALVGEPGSATVAAARACPVQAQRDDWVGPHGRTG